MNILFLTLVNIRNFEEKYNIYTDLCRELVRRGHRVHIVCANESGKETKFIPYGKDSGVLQVQTGKIQKTNLVRKGFATLLLGRKFKSAIRHKLRGYHYDLIMYSTPPITLENIVSYIKKRDGAKSYLLLKDIFPQNALDLGMMCKYGVKAPIYWYFRRMERKLYRISDRIGCMSAANVEYILKHEPQIPAKKIHINPNSFEAKPYRISKEERNCIRKIYGLPINKKIFVYGGNIGRPQGVSFIIECMKMVSHLEDCYFVICGTGTEFDKLATYMLQSKQKNLKLIPGLPREEYEKFVGCCDVGLIFLDHRFTIPNFPSRLLSYMQKSMPVLACTDPISDVGKAIEEGNFGRWCESDDPNKFVEAVHLLCREDLGALGENAATWLVEHYNVQRGVEIILDECVGVLE